MNLPTTSEQPPFVITEQPRPVGYPTLNQSWWLIGVFFLMQLPATLPALGLKFAADRFGLPVLNVIGETLAYVIAIGLTILYAFRKRGSRSLSWRSVPVAAYPVAALGMLALSSLAEPLVSAIPMPAELEKIVAELFTKNMIIAAVIAAPILEEVLFRGIILDGFLKNYSPTKAIIWSGIIFGGIHLIPAQAVNAMFLGFALGWLYYRTRSLGLCMFLHFVNNGVSSLTFLVSDTMDMSQNVTQSWVGNDTLYIGLLIGCVGVCLACYAYLNRILPKSIQA
ncbi:CPBP family intramembrane glutamic endopeptidase [Spirosoma oryzicola]|uniref:CPBP family intramembrane glutamic endopeptidase n=1 Tax=Spirosoma oryzicola TaxID=2898794 RepID=UPI001E2A9DB7|nr:type II CAAX endopeptidase family protein [Spirosoma oryzicola]UHG91202.1 CPBP family intramembrane metalloprotease [Spirosoma oryzicola]